MVFVGREKSWKTVAGVSSLRCCLCSGHNCSWRRRWTTNSADSSRQHHWKTRFVHYCGKM